MGVPVNITGTEFPAQAVPPPPKLTEAVGEGRIVNVAGWVVCEGQAPFENTALNKQPLVIGALGVKVRFEV